MFYTGRRSRVAVLGLAIVAGGSVGRLPAAAFVRGDVDESGIVEMTDAIRIFRYLFLDVLTDVRCGDVADVDDSGVVDISDGVEILSYLFLGESRPVSPYPRPGFDRTVTDSFPCGDIIGGPARPLDLDANGGHLHVPRSYDGSMPVPLMLLLHGDPMTGRGIESLAGYTSLSEREGFLYAYPDGGVVGQNGTNRGWDVSEQGVDSTYLRRAVDDIKMHYNVDPNHVWLQGVSAGGHMSYRMACDHPGAISGIIVNAGVMPEDTSTCSPDMPVRVLHIHGTLDGGVPYWGGNVYRGVVQMSAPDSVRQWATYNECSLEPETGRMDFSPTISGDETAITRYLDCSPGGSAELWAVEGAGHVPRSGGRNPWLARVLGEQP